MDHSNRNLAFHPKSAAPATPDEAHVPIPGSAADPAPAIRIEEILDVLRRGERFRCWPWECFWSSWASKPTW
jgi:hypothetical protein